MRQAVLLTLVWPLLTLLDAAATAPKASAAMCFQGGGFRALASHAGVTAGMLSFVGKQSKIAKPTMSGTGLMERFDTFSSVSGGSWYFSELVYSQRFHSLMEEFAANPQTGSRLFTNQWFDSFKADIGVTPEKFDPLRDLAIKVCTELLGKADEDTLFTVQYIMATNGTWNEFVRILLNSTASVTDQTLIAPVDTWAKDKYWLADHTIILPSAEKPAIIFQGKGLDGFQSVKYQVEGSGTIPELIPAKFSVRLGSEDQSAPFPYMAPEAAAGVESFEYKGVVVPFFDKPTANSGPLGTDLAQGALTVTKLPVWGATAASSAFLGGIALYGDLANEVAALVHGDFTPWVSRAPDGASFATGLDLVHNLDRHSGDNRKNIDDLAQNAVHGITDAGYTDGTGLGIAVGAGATEVLLLLDSNETGSADDIDQLFTGGPKSSIPGASADLYPLFANAASTIRKTVDNLPSLVLPSGTQFLKNLKVGTIDVVTTDNKYFGLKAGQKVTVHIVQTWSSLSIGYFVRYVNFGTFAQEVAMTLNSKENEAIVKSTVLPMFIKTAIPSEGSPALVV